MTAERRYAYRVSVDGAEELRAEIRGEYTKAFGDVLDLSLHGAAIRVLSSDDPTFPVGQMVAIRLDSETMRTVEIVATVQTNTDRGRFRRIGLAFSNPAALHAKLSTELLHLFNERRTARFEPAAALPVTVRLPGDTFVALGRIRDISADGLGVILEADAEETLWQANRLTVEFSLPGQDRPLVLQASIRYRWKAEEQDASCLGLSFDPDGTPEFVFQQQQITEYIAELQHDHGRHPVEA